MSSFFVKLAGFGDMLKELRRVTTDKSSVVVDLCGADENWRPLIRFTRDPGLKLEVGTEVGIRVEGEDELHTAARIRERLFKSGAVTLGPVEKALTDIRPTDLPTEEQKDRAWRQFKPTAEKYLRRMMLRRVYDSLAVQTPRRREARGRLRDSTIARMAAHYEKYLKKQGSLPHRWLLDRVAWELVRARGGPELGGYLQFAMRARRKGQRSIDAPSAETVERKRQAWLEAIGLFHKLPPNLAAALHMGVVVGLSAKEIADVMGVSVSTVRRRIRQGKELLKKELDELLSSDQAFDHRTVDQTTRAPPKQRGPPSGHRPHKGGTTRGKKK